MKPDDKEGAQDGVESAASLLRAGRLSGEVDEAVWASYEQVKGTINSASIGKYQNCSIKFSKQKHPQAN